MKIFAQLNRPFSLAVALVYLFWFGSKEGSDGILIALIFLILPMAAIWFGEYMGSFLGFAFLSRSLITAPTPGLAVVVAGWILLLSPFVALIIIETQR